MYLHLAVRLFDKVHDYFTLPMLLLSIPSRISSMETILCQSLCLPHMGMVLASGDVSASLHPYPTFYFCQLGHVTLS